MDILKAYDWRVLPTFIKIEHHHIDDIKMKKMLEERGYIVYTEGRDIYAVRQNYRILNCTKVRQISMCSDDIKTL